MRIKPLSTLLANQIAAGEVIERPASVVKEILENALDANASSIDINISKGGTQQILIRDNGHGIHHEDLPLAIAPHATSKISELKDLSAIASLGFRGEALASISSVSRLSIISKIAAARNAWALRMEGRDMQPKCTPESHPLGTTIEVRDLFFNTPARRKFLRSERTEYLHIEDIVKRIILSRFDVAFVLNHNKRQIYHLLPATTQTAKQQRVAKVLGNNFIQQAVHIEAQANGLGLNGWLSLPSYTRSQADGNYCYINGRSIKDKVINHAIRQAYQDTLPSGRFPVYCLYITIDTALVDVNVHPTKHEVRFHQARLVHDFLVKSLRDALGHNDRLQTIKQAPDYPRPPIEKNWQVQQSCQAYGSVKQTDDTQPQQTEVMFEQAMTEQTQPTAKISLGKVIAQLHKRYILTELGDGLGILNQVESQRVLIKYRLTESYQNNKLVQQPLLLPQLIKLQTDEIEIVEQQQALLNHLGFQFELLGPDAVRLLQIPSLLHETNVTILAHTLLQFLRDNSTETGQATWIDALVRSLVDAAYPSDPRQLSKEEMQQLLRDLELHSAKHCKRLCHKITLNELTAS